MRIALKIISLLRKTKSCQFDLTGCPIPKVFCLIKLWKQRLSTVHELTILLPHLWLVLAFVRLIVACQRRLSLSEIRAILEGIIPLTKEYSVI